MVGDLRDREPGLGERAAPSRRSTAAPRRALTRKRAKSTSPVLSETEISARLTARSVVASVSRRLEPFGRAVIGHKTGQRLAQPAELAPLGCRLQRIEGGLEGRPVQRAGIDAQQAGDAGGGGLLLLAIEPLMQLLARTLAGEDDLDVHLRLLAGETDHLAGEVDDAHRLAHVEHEDGARLARARPNAAACSTSSTASRMVMK